MKPIHWVLGIIGVLLFCCVGSCGVAMLSGAAGMQGPVATTASTATGGIEGAWSAGSTYGFTDYQSLTTGEFAPPSGTGTHYKFKPGGRCEHYALFQNSMGGCTSSIFIAHPDCEWDLEGNQLTVDFGDAETLTKACGGDLKRSSSDGSKRTMTVTLTGDELVLTEEGSSLTLRRER